MTVILKRSPAQFHLSCRPVFNAERHLPPVEVAASGVEAKSFPPFVPSPVKMSPGDPGSGGGRGGGGVAIRPGDSGKLAL